MRSGVEGGEGVVCAVCACVCGVCCRMGGKKINKAKQTKSVCEGVWLRVFISMAKYHLNRVGNIFKIIARQMQTASKPDQDKPK